MPAPTLKKPKAKTNAKKSRLSALLRHDAAIMAERENACRLVGLDEVGRGSLIAGVVGGAAWLPPVLTREQKQLLKWLDDSKKLTPAVRAELAEGIRSFCLVGIGVTTKEEVDELNVHYASLLALYRAFSDLCQQAAQALHHPDWFLLLDGRAVIPDLSRAVQRPIVKGDGCSAAIAAASVVAKEYRDGLIRSLAEQYPGYDWENNMGYATPAHLKGIREKGLTPLHRKNFRQVHQQLLLPFGDEDALN
jgi:ribonuclease HII